MHVSMEQLQALVAAADHGSFTSAAKALGCAQSAVSVQITTLEIDLGITLFKRTGRTPVLTSIGERVLREARVVLERRHRLMGIAKSYEQQIEQRLVVAFDELYPEEALGPMLAKFAKQFPHVELKLLFPLMEDVSELVVNGQADLGVLWRQDAPLHPALDFVRIAYASMVLVCGKGHPFTASPVNHEDLKRHRQIVVASRSGTDNSRWRFGSEVWSVESHWVTLQLVKQNIGWALISNDVLKESVLRADLVIPEVRFDGFGLPAPLDMVWAKNRGRGPAMKWLQGLLYETQVGYASDRKYGNACPDF